MAIDDTVAGPSANSYIDVADAQTYFDGRLNSDAWDDSFTQEEALIHACQILDQMDWVGFRSSDDQALEWPRYADEDLTELIRNYEIDTIPEPIRKAQCEIALWLLETGGSGVVAGGDVESVRIGNSVEVKYSSSSTSGSTSSDSSVDFQGLPVQASRYLKGLRYVVAVA